MIHYARRKKKQDLFVLWLGLSTMTFGIAGATLRGVSAVKAVPVLIDSEPVAIEIAIVPAAVQPDLATGAGGALDPAEPATAPEPAAHPAASPFDSADPLPLPLPKPILDPVDDLAPDPVDPGETPAEPEPKPVAEPPPAPEEVTPPEPEPDKVKPAVVNEPKVEAKPPVPKKVTPKAAAPPRPRPAPRASPATKDPKLAVQRPKVIYKAPLRFPVEAQRRGWGGKILLEARVGTSGAVENIRVIKGSGYKMLDAEAIAAVKASRFEPARNAYGKPLAHTIQIPMNFAYASAR